LCPTPELTTEYQLMHYDLRTHSVEIICWTFCKLAHPCVLSHAEILPTIFCVCVWPHTCTQFFACMMGSHPVVLLFNLLMLHHDSKQQVSSTTGASASSFDSACGSIDCRVCTLSSFRRITQQNRHCRNVHPCIVSSPLYHTIHCTAQVVLCDYYFIHLYLCCPLWKVSRYIAVRRQGWLSVASLADCLRYTCFQQ
jgi:hypothetical protein